MIGAGEHLVVAGAVAIGPEHDGFVSEVLLAVA